MRVAPHYIYIKFIRIGNMMWIKLALTFCLAIISQVTIGQTYKRLIKFRFPDKVEAHYVGNLMDSIHSQPAFDPVAENYNKDSIIQIINVELDKYPLKVLKLSRLVEIVICDGVYFNDENNRPTVRAIGTYIYPVVDYGNVIFLDGYSSGLPKTLHHEFSSVLFNQMVDSDPKFEKKCLETLSYFKKTTNYIDDSPNWVDDHKFDFPKNTDNKLVLRNDGYALTSFENDYNSIASSLFAPKNVKLIGEQLVENDQDLWEFLKIARTKQYPIFYKVVKIIDLYNYINPIFTMDYFKKMEMK